MKKLLLFLLLGVFHYTSNAGGGYFDSEITLDGTNSSTGTPTDFGRFPVGDDLLLGGQIRTWKNGSTDITGAKLFYTITDASNNQVSQGDIAYSFQFNKGEAGAPPELQNDGDQQWGTKPIGQNGTDGSVNILANLSPGNYTITYYVEVYTNGSDTDPILYDSNNGANYTATFEIYDPLLPVKLATFEVLKDMQGQALIKWTTASECNASHFEVQRSTNGVDFETISEIATQGGGQSCIGASYEFIDQIALNKVFASKLFYRLHMVDLDQTSDNSDILFINANTKNFVFFNMSSKELAVDNLDGQFSLTITNNNGAIVREEHTTNGSFNMSDLKQGFYFATIEQNGQRVTEKFVIQ